MSFIRPATPGFLVTLVATGLLAVVTFSVPYIKSIFFLKASLSVENINGSITFGTLGYCLNLSNGTTCSKPSVGYELNVNALLGDDLPIQIPNVLVKWVTYALVLHIVALVLAALSAFFGLLAHVREVSMAYCSSFISGFAAAVAMVAFIFDLVLFFVTKSRINAVKGGSASMGIGIWLTLAAWILLFFAGCFYGIGRCCIRRRPDRFSRNGPSGDNGYAEQMRLDAVKAEADRKARQKQGEIGLPAFQELEQMQPLTRAADEDYVEDGDKIVPLGEVQNAGVGTYRRQPSQTRAQFPGGYSQAPPGTRAVDAYYNPNTSPALSSIYPPQSPPQTQRRQGSGHTQDGSGYAASAYSHGGNAAGVGTGAAAAAAAGAATGQYLSSAYGHAQQPTAATDAYGHTAGGSSYYNRAPSHQQYASNYSMPAPTPQAFDENTYNASGYMHAVGTSSSSAAATAAQNPYYGRAAPQDRSYTLGGGAAYAGNDAAYYDPYAASSHNPAPAPINTQVSAGGAHAQSPTHLVESPLEGIPEGEHQYADSPPMYDAATAQPPGMWATKH